MNPFTTIRIRTLFVVLLYVLVFAFGAGKLYPLLLHNLIRVEFLKTLMADDISALERQADLARILAIGEWLPTQTSQDVMPVAECEMLPALLHAQYHFRAKDWRKTLAWIAVARNSPALPLQQRPIFVPLSVTIRPDERIAIPFVETEWRLNGNNPNVDLRIPSPEEVQIEFPNQQEVRDILIYSWQTDIHVAYQPNIHLDVWLRQGTFLTVETGTNQGTRVRHISYYQGEGKWASFDLPLNANLLNVMYISLGEPGESGTSVPQTNVPSYEAIIRAPTLPLAVKLGTCNVIVPSVEP